MQAIPEDAPHPDSGDEDEEDPDKRVSSKRRVQVYTHACNVSRKRDELSWGASSSCVLVRAHDKRIACDEEFSDSEDEAEGQGGGRRNAANHKKVKRVKKEEEKEGEEKKGET